MKIHMATACVTMAISTAAFAASNQFERTLSVSAQPNLYLSTGSGNITIHPGSGSQIHIVGHIHAGWAAFGDIQSRINQIIANPPIKQEGHDVHVGETNDHSLFNNISIDYDVSVPADTALNLHSGSGDIVTNQVGRYLTASSGSGNVSAHGIHGPADLGSGSGDIVLDETGAGDIKAKTGSGNIRISGLNGGLTTRSGSGDTEVSGRLNGPANLSSGSGDLRLRLPSDAHFDLEASTGSGDIHVDYPNAPKQSDTSRHHLTAAINGGGPPLEVRTGSGDIEIVQR
jgi:DUF4097 and DUF4098 domain-containing protein YvlB